MRGQMLLEPHPTQSLSLRESGSRVNWDRPAGQGRQDRAGGCGPATAANSRIANFSKTRMRRCTRKVNNLANLHQSGIDGRLSRSYSLPRYGTWSLTPIRPCTNF